MHRKTFVLVLFAIVLGSSSASLAQETLRNPNDPIQKSVHKLLAARPAVLNSQQPSIGAGRPPDPTPLSTHEKFATFLAGDGFKSTLLLQNFRPDLPITFRPTLIVSAGEVALNPVTVAAHSSTTLDMNAILQERDIKDTQGTVAVQFEFSSYGPASIVAQMSDDKNHVYLNSYAQSTEEYWSGTQYDGVVWAPTENTEGFISVTNASTVSHIVNITFLSKGGSEQRMQVDVPPRQTRRVSINALLAQTRKTGAGIHIEYTQAPSEEYPGAILVEGQLFNKKTGFAKNIHFMDKALPPTGTLRSNFLLLGRQPIEDNFPTDVSFRSVAAIHNIDGVAVKITPAVKFLRKDVVQTIALPARSINVHDTLLIDFNEEQKAGHLPADFSQGSLELTPDSGRASIVGELFNFSQNGGFVIGPSFNSYPTRSTSSIWRTDGSFQTTIMVENTADSNDGVTIHLYSEHGQYTKSFPIASGKLLKINLKDLQQKGVPDDSGHLLEDTSGVMSLIASHSTRSKLSYDKIVHSADESDYVGLPINACDYVSSIGMWVDTSGTMPFAVMKTYYWTQSGPEDTQQFGSVSSNSSWAQITDNGSGDFVTLTLPNDGLVHQVTLSPSFPDEDVTFCDACSAGEVFVEPTTIGGKTLNLLTDTCTINPSTHLPTIAASWGIFGGGCALNDTGPPLPPGGSCVENGTAQCYELDTPTCRTQFCPATKRTANSTCTEFLDEFQFASNRIPAGCS